MSGTSLVHPRTAHLPPEEQARGSYEYTSPEELSRLSTLKSAEMQRLSGVNTEPTTTGRIKAEMPNIPNRGKVVRKPTARTLVDMDYSQLECRMAAILLVERTDDVLGLLTPPVKEDIFTALAEQLGYTVE